MLANKIPTKLEQAPPSSPGRLESTRDRLATLFAGFSPFGSPSKPINRASPSKYEVNANPVIQNHPSLPPLGRPYRSPWRGKPCLMDLPDELIVHVLSFLPNDHNHLILASWVNRRLSHLAKTSKLWTNLIENTVGPKLIEGLKERGTTMTPPGKWTSSGVWTPNPVTSQEIHYPTLFQSRRLLDRVVRGRKLKGSPHVDTLRFPAHIYSIHASGPWLILGSKDKSVQIWRTSVDNNVLVKKVMNAHDGSVIALAVDESAHGAKMITGSSDGTAGVWDITWGPATEEEGDVRNGNIGTRWRAEVVRRETLRGHTAAVLDVALAKDFIITCSKDTTIRIYNRYDYTLVRAIVGLHTAPVNCLALHPDPNVPEFISASGEGSWIRGPIQFPTFYTRHSRISAQEGGQALACVAWKGPLVVTGAKDGQLGVYDAKGEFLADYTRHSDSVRAVDLEVDETGAGTIVSASYDKSVVMWDADSGLERYVFDAHSSIVLDVQLTNGRLITASHDQTVQIRTFGVDLPYRDLFV